MLSYANASDTKLVDKPSYIKVGQTDTEETLKGAGICRLSNQQLAL